MSQYGWRWWDISKTGALMSVNSIIWEPNDTVTAECSPWGVRNHSKHDRIAVLPDGRQRKVAHDMPLGMRSNGVNIIEEGAPAERCHCGLWAYYDPESAFALPRSHNGTYLRSTKVFGVIEAWGDMWWHELGFRAEFAIVRAVVVTRGRLHPAYEIPRYRNLEEIAEVWDITPLVDEEP